MPKAAGSKTKAASNKQAKTRRNFEETDTDDLIDRLIHPELDKRSKAKTRLFQEWHEIVGTMIAKHTNPKKLFFPKRGLPINASLQIIVDPAFAQDLKDKQVEIVDRINTYLGFRLVKRLRLSLAPYERRFNVTNVGSLVERVTRPALKKRSAAEVRLFLDWHMIVKNYIAKHTQPAKLTFPYPTKRINGTLLITVDPSFALDLQHIDSVLIDRINAHFGFCIVKRIRLTQAPYDRDADAELLDSIEQHEGGSVPATWTPLSPEEEENFMAAPAPANGPEDPELRMAFERLKRAMRARNKARKI